MSNHAPPRIVDAKNFRGTPIKQVRYYDQHGKRRKKDYGTEAEARRWIRNEYPKILKGTFVADADSNTVLATGIAFIRDCETRGLSRKTWVDYERHLTKYINPAFGDRTLNSITGPEVTEFLNTLWKKRGKDLARRIRYTLQSVFAFAISTGAAGHNPVAHFKFRTGRHGRSKEIRKRLEIPSHEDVRKLLEEAKAFHGLYPMLMIIVFAGLRSGEVRALRVADLDLTHNTITVNGAVDDYGRLGEPKSVAGYRTIPVPRDVLEAVAEWLPQRPHEGGPRDLVFPSKAGRPLLAANITRNRLDPMLAIAKEKHGIELPPKRKFHILRHWCVSNWIALGWDDKDVQRMAGHDDITTTHRIYWHQFQQRRSQKEQDARMAQLTASVFGPTEVKDTSRKAG